MKTTFNIQVAVVSVKQLVRQLKQQLNIARINAKGCRRFAIKYSSTNAFMRSWSEFMHECKLIKSKIAKFEKHLSTLLSFNNSESLDRFDLSQATLRGADLRGTEIIYLGTDLRGTEIMCLGTDLTTAN